MEQPRDELIKSIFLRACELPGKQVGRYLDEACSGDESLRREVELLLSHDKEATDEFLQSPVEGELEARSGEPTGIGSDTLPSEIGGYRIIRKLGEGGMGVVYKANQEMPRRTVALKVIRPNAVNERTLERFEFETRVLAKLQHPGIAQIYAAGTADVGAGPQPYFAMELVRGRPLREYVASLGLAVRERLTLVRKIAEAVHHAHSRGVIHRDLKPANILVTDEGEPKILDFGVARSVESDTDPTHARTEMGQLVGTVPYMSPEQVAGDPDDLDARSDVYSLGVVLFEVLAGSLPYDLERKVVTEAIRVIREEEPTRLSNVSREFRGDVETIVQKALDKERSRRYQSAWEFAQDIGRYLTDQPIEARPPSAFYQARKFAKRHTGLFAGSLAAVLALAAGLATTTLQMQRAIKAENAALESYTNELEARQSAESRYDKLRRLTGVFSEFEHELRRLEGATAARRVLARSALEVLSELADEVDTDQELLLDVADGHLRVAQIAVSGEDTVETAAGAFERAIELADRLGAGGRSGEITVLARAGLARAMARRGQSAAAQLEATSALELARELRSADAWYALGDALRARGGLLLNAGREGEALALYRELTSLATERVGTDERATDLVADGARGEGVALQRTSRHAEAAERFDHALDVRREQVARSPRDAIAKRRLLEALDLRAALHDEQREVEAALALQQEKLPIATALVEADPVDPHAHDDLIVTHEQIAQHLRRLKRYEPAERSAELSHEAAIRAAEIDPLNLLRRRRLGLALELRGEIARETRNLEQSDSFFDEAIGIFEWLVEVDPNTPTYRNDLSRALLEKGTVFLYQNKLEEAEQLHVRAVEILETLDEGGDVDAATKGIHSIGVRNLARLRLMDEQFSDALELFERADELGPRRTPGVLQVWAQAAFGAGEMEQAIELASEAERSLETSNPEAPRLTAIREDLDRYRGVASGPEGASAPERVE